MNSEKNPFFHGEIAVGSTQAAHKISDHKYVTDARTILHKDLLLVS